MERGGEEMSGDGWRQGAGRAGCRWGRGGVALSSVGTAVADSAQEALAGGGRGGGGPESRVGPTWHAPPAPGSLIGARSMPRSQGVGPGDAAAAAGLTVG